MDNDTGEDGISGTGVAYAIRLPIGFAAGTELTADSTLEDTTKVNVQIPDLKKEKKESEISEKDIKKIKKPFGTIEKPPIKIEIEKDKDRTKGGSISGGGGGGIELRPHCFVKKDPNGCRY